MKTISQLILAAVLPAVLLSGCSGEPEGKSTDGVRTVEVGITSGAAMMRTAYEYDSQNNLHRTRWNVGDRLGLFAYDDSGHIPAELNRNLPFGIGSDADIAANGVAMFRGDMNLAASYPDGETVDGHYFAYYPYQANAKGDQNGLTISLPPLQTSEQGTFDGNADILLGIPVNTTAPAGEMAANGGSYVPVNFSFIRPFAIACLTLTDLPQQIPADETAGTVTIAAAEGLAVAGDFRTDISSAAPSVMLDGNGALVTDNGTNRITLTTAQTFGQTDIKLWFVAAPVTTPTLEIAVETENWRVTRSIDSEIKLEAGKLNLANISLAQAEVVRKSPPKPATYRLVATAAELTDGEYLMIAENGGTYYTAGGENGDWLDAISVDPALHTEGAFTDDELNTLHGNSVRFTRVAAGWTIRSNRAENAGCYLYAAGSTAAGNQLKLRAANDDDRSVWLVTDNADGTTLLNIEAATDQARSKSIRFDTNGGAPRFTCFNPTSLKPRVSLYRRAGETTTDAEPVEVPHGL